MKKKNLSINEKAPILMDESTPFAIRESFNQFRTNLMYTFTESDGCPIFGITSVNEGTGKSTLLTNLALSFSQIGKKVLLVDADMRCPAIYRFFDIDPNHPGLSEVISGIESNVIIENVKPSLHLITSGRIPPNPSELLTSKKLKDLLQEWKQSYDIIFLDFPPVGLITDAVTVCQELDGYIFTVSSGKDNAKEVNNCIASMEQIGAKIVGIVLNDYNLKGSSSYYYRNRYTGYHKYKSNSHKSRYEASYKNHYQASYEQHKNEDQKDSNK